MSAADYSQGPVAGPPPNTYANENATGPAAPAGNNSFLSNEVPLVPGWLKFLLAPIIFLTILVLGLNAYAAHTFNGALTNDTTDFGGISFTLFACSWTILLFIFLLFAFFLNTSIHYRWPIFILLCLTDLWWLVAFAYEASNAHYLMNIVSEVNSLINEDESTYEFGGLKRFVKRQYDTTTTDYGSYVNALVSDWNNFKTAAKCTAAGAGIGALIWILFLVFTAFYGLALFRNRSTAPSAAAATAPAAPSAVYPTNTYTTEPKYEMNQYQHTQPPEQVPTPAPTYDATGNVPPRDFVSPVSAVDAPQAHPNAGYVNAQFGGQPQLE